MQRGSHRGPRAARTEIRCSPRRLATASQAGRVDPVRWARWRARFRLAIDEETLTDELFAFVLDPRSTRLQRRIVGELRALAPGMIPVMEMMILDGVEERRYVRDYVAAVIGGGEDRDVYYALDP